MDGSFNIGRRRLADRARIAHELLQKPQARGRGSLLLPGLTRAGAASTRSSLALPELRDLDTVRTL